MKVYFQANMKNWWTQLLFFSIDVEEKKDQIFL